MARNAKYARKLAYGLVRQSAAGTPLDKDDLTKFLRLTEPLVYDDMPEWLDDMAEVGKGHEFPTQDYLNARHLEMAISRQAMPIEAISYFIALATGNTSASADTDGYTHTSIIQPVATTPSSWLGGFGIDEDGSDVVLNDLALSELTIGGEGTGRLECGANFFGSKVSALAAMSWPSSVALNYVNNFSGDYTVAAVDKKSQLTSFNMTYTPGLATDRAWQKQAAEADRVYPASFTYDPESRSFNFDITFQAEDGDFDIWRGYHQDRDEIAIVISCKGAFIGGTDPYKFQMTVPKAVVTELAKSWDQGILSLTATFKANWDSSSSTIATFACSTNDANAIAVQS